MESDREIVSKWLYTTTPPEQRSAVGDAFAPDRLDLVEDADPGLWAEWVNKAKKYASSR